MSTEVSTMPAPAHTLSAINSQQTIQPTLAASTTAPATPTSSSLQDAISYITNGFLEKFGPKFFSGNSNQLKVTAKPEQSETFKSLYTDKGLEPLINTVSDPNAVFKWQDTSNVTKTFKKKFKDIGVPLLSQEDIQKAFNNEYKEFNSDTHVGATFCLDANEIGEDVTVANKYDDGYTLFSTFDGHGGPLAGRLLACELHNFVHDKLSKAKTQYGHELLKNNELFDSVVKDATVEYDSSAVRTRRRFVKDGAVGTFAISRPDGKMTYALTGDCRPYEFRQDNEGTISAKLMLEPHTAENDEMMSQIAAEFPNAVRFDGRTWRYNGQIMPLRAFYDESHKQDGEVTLMTRDPLTNEPIQNGVMSAEPTVITVDPVTKDGTRVGFGLLSDGWDAIGAKEISEVLNSLRGKSMKDFAAALTNRLEEDLSIPPGLARKLSGDDKGAWLVFDKYAVGSDVHTSGTSLRDGDRLISERALYV